MVEDKPQTVGQLLNLLYALIEGGIVDENESVRVFRHAFGYTSAGVNTFEVRIATNGGMYFVPNDLVDDAKEYLGDDEEGFALMTPEEALREVQDDDA